MSPAEAIRDARALGLKDIPFSAYCRVCWQSVYSCWVDSEDHKGVCPFGAKVIGDCQQALDWERMKGEIKSYLKAIEAGQ